MDSVTVTIIPWVITVNCAYPITMTFRGCLQRETKRTNAKVRIPSQKKIKRSAIQSIINILQNGAYMEQNTTQKVDIPHTNTDYKSNSY